MEESDPEVLEEVSRQADVLDEVIDQFSLDLMLDGQDDASNAILICHALSGSGHAAGYHSADDDKPGWWDDCIGPGKAFDTDRYFVICSNVIGSCFGSSGPMSIDPATGQPYGLHFPVVTIGDMVHHLTDGPAGVGRATAKTLSGRWGIHTQVLKRKCITSPSLTM